MERDSYGIIHFILSYNKVCLRMLLWVMILLHVAFKMMEIGQPNIYSWMKYEKLRMEAWNCFGHRNIVEGLR